MAMTMMARATMATRTCHLRCMHCFWHDRAPFVKTGAASPAASFPGLRRRCEQYGNDDDDDDGDVMLVMVMAVRTATMMLMVAMMMMATMVLLK